MALPPSTANWHWKNKNVTKWGKEWFERELTSISLAGDSEGETVRIDSVFDVEGDIELGQRKSKLITIYDCKLILDWVGTASDGTDVKGRVHIPEVSHEITLDGLSEYTYMWEISSPSDRNAAVESLFTLVKTKMPALLEEKFAKLPIDLIEIHGKDLTVSTDPSRSGTPAPSPAAPSVAASTSSASTAGPTVKQAQKTNAMNTTTVFTEATFMAAADDLFSLLTDEKRIPTWSRAAAKSAAQPDTEYFLFGGGVKGKYISLTPGKEIVQSWVLDNPTWPAGHIATLTTSFTQSTDSTTVAFSLNGVPLGMEDEIKKNIEGYYVHGLKSIGLGSVL